MTHDSATLKGEVTWELRGPDGEVKDSGVVHNLVTDTGDNLYAQRGIGVTTTGLPTGMQLGTGSTTAAKNGAGAAVVTYLSTSDHTFDSTYPSAANSAGNGTTVTYVCTFAAGEGTTSGSPIAEAAIVNKTLVSNGAAGGSGAAAGAVISRVVLGTPVTKAAADSLKITWTHTLKGT